MLRLKSQYLRVVLWGLVLTWVLILMGGAAWGQIPRVPSESSPGSGSSFPEGDTGIVEDSTRKTPPFALSSLRPSDLTWTGYLRNETAFRIKEPMSFTKMLTIFNLEPRFRLGRSASLGGRIRGFYDSTYDLVDIDTISPRKGPITILSENLTKEQVETLEGENVRHVEVQKTGIDLPEIYLDMYLPFADLRIGKQIVRWGVVEGSRVTDEINPLDLGEFILRDVVDRYIPLWMVKADLFLGDYNLQTIWIPDLKFHQPAAREGEWEQFRFLPSLQKPASPIDDPIQNIANSEIAFRLSRLIAGWDLSFSYFYTWDDFPAAFRDIGVIGFAALPQVDPIAFRPSYARLHIPGFTLSKALGKMILNAEAAYVVGKIFGTRLGAFTQTVGGDPVVGFGEIQADYFKYAIGLDSTLWRTEISGQILQQFIPVYRSDIIQDRVDTVLTIFLRRPSLGNLLTSQILTLYFVNDQEWLIRPRMEYAVTDQTRLAFGGDLMVGTIADAGPDGRLIPGQFHFVGYFKNNSRVYAEVQYSF